LCAAVLVSEYAHLFPLYAYLASIRDIRGSASFILGFRSTSPYYRIYTGNLASIQLIKKRQRTLRITSPINTFAYK